MVVGKPDFELNSFGIQYKEKKVSYTNKRAGINVASGTQTENESQAENKVMNTATDKDKPKAFKPLSSSTSPVEQAEGKKFENKDPQKPTSATPSSSITPKDGVFDNVPQSKGDMITQEGGSTHKDKDPAMPRTKLHGRAHQESQAELRESKQNPVLPKNAANEIILKMNILKLDLMKENKFQETSTNARISPSGDIKHLEDVGVGEGTVLREASTLDGRTGSTAPLERKDPPNKMGGKTGHAGSMPKQTGKKGTPKVDPRMRKKDPIKTIPKTASETIFKAISLKLDLAKALSSNAGSTLVAAGTKKGKPNHINDKGERTQDGQHTVRGKGVGTPEQVTIDGVKTTQPRTVAVKPKGNEKTSLAGDMHMSDGLTNASTGEIKESFNMITESPKWKEEINRDAPLTEKEGTEKFDAADPTTQNILARQAKRDAAKKKRGEKVNRAISEINAMTDGMKELMKRDGEKIGIGEKDTRNWDDKGNEEWGLPDTKEGKNAKRMLDDHISPV